MSVYLIVLENLVNSIEKPRDVERVQSLKDRIPIVWSKWSMPPNVLAAWIK